MFLIFFACHSPEKNLDNYQKINNVKDSNKTCCENSRIKYLNEESAYISNNKLSLNSTKNVQIDDEMKIEDNIISEICFKSILERNSNSRTLEKINADAEKLLGNTNKQIVDAGINK